MRIGILNVSILPAPSNDIRVLPEQLWFGSSRSESSYTYSEQGLARLALSKCALRFVETISKNAKFQVSVTYARNHVDLSFASLSSER
jgi:hypothetical protein